MPEKGKNILLRLYRLGGCDAADEWSQGWDKAIEEAIRVVEEETGLDLTKLLDKEEDYEVLQHTAPDHAGQLSEVTV